ncbi:uncharacterized protein LOC143663607 isoform X2 [Tamandua tetradactyla]|uniref:uncharacterized protein LOC143663607 isoform X2 n=1 Tax=Tamandua tetradactyla TaxID=48850 RepID=UPI004053A05C
MRLRWSRGQKSEGDVLVLLGAAMELLLPGESSARARRSPTRENPEQCHLWATGALWETHLPFRRGDEMGGWRGEVERNKRDLQKEWIQPTTFESTD